MMVKEWGRWGHGARLRPSLDIRRCCFSPTAPRGAGVRTLDGWHTDWRWSSIQDWGAEAITTAWKTWWGDTPGILFSFYDPARCFCYLDLPIRGLQRWGYFAVDAHNVHHSFSGPAAEAVRGYDRVLAYTKYGASVLDQVIPVGAVPTKHLPHGIDTSVFKPVDPTGVAAHYLGFKDSGWPTGRRLIGCVTTNQPRKDLGFTFEVMRELLDRGLDLHLWLHIDEQHGEWSVPALYEDYHLEGRLSCTQGLDDRQLAALYSACSATIAPGRGEGFGYPILESQFCETPVVHVDYAGGAEFVWPGDRVKVVSLHAEGPYNLLRPIMDVSHAADILERMIRDRISGKPAFVMPPAAAQCDWATLWPAWETWIEEGL